MDPTRLASFDLGSFDPAASRPRRRTPGARKPVSIASTAPAPDTTDLRDAVASLARQLGEAQAANAALARRLDDHLDEPRRAALTRANLHHLMASRF